MDPNSEELDNEYLRLLADKMDLVPVRIEELDSEDGYGQGVGN